MDFNEAFQNLLEVRSEWVIAFVALAGAVNHGFCQLPEATG